MAAPLDTSADAHEAQTDAYRLMGGTERLAATFRLTELARQTAIAGIRSRHPEYDDARLRLAFARLVLGDEWVRRVWPDHGLVEP